MKSSFSEVLGVLTVWILFSWIKTTFARTDLLNVTGEETSHRDKRFLIYQEFGVHKFIAGFSIPVNLYDKKPWRSLGAVYNLQAQYGVPTTPLYWWDKWDGGRTLVGARQQYDKDGTYVPDESRVFAYSLIESFMTFKGKNGKQCLLRAICDNAKIHETDGIWGKMLHMLLTPNKDTPEEYRDAYKGGRYGAVCLSMFPKCPMGDGLLDGIEYIERKVVFKKT